MFSNQQRYVLLGPTERSVLAVNALLHGPCPPIGVTFHTWRDCRNGWAEAIPWHEFGCIADACPGLLSDLAEVRDATRELRLSTDDALAAR